MTLSPAAPIAASRRTDATGDPFPEDGSRLVFVIGPFRGGTTLLRKMLDGHSRLHSPAETWFLLPLLELWHGRGTAEGFAPAQAAAALRQHLDEPAFLACCRAFAARFYTQTLPGPELLFVDKTPLYLPIADVLPTLFPRARFLVLTRDPRALLWSRATWRHATERDPRAHVDGVVADVQRLASFLDHAGDRARRVSYEAVCRDAEAAVRDITDFLELPFEPGMIEYGRHPHHEGYGDENTRAHVRPHAESIDRWRGPDGLDADVGATLLDRCGPDALGRLGLDALGPPGPDTLTRPGLDLGSERPTRGSTPHRGGPDGPQLVAFLHPGTNSRDHLLDFVRGFEQAGCIVARVELASLVAEEPAGADRTRGNERTAAAVEAALRTHGADASLALWANGVAGLPTARVDGVERPLFDVLGVPHLAFWLDAPHWAYQGGFHTHFGSSLLAGTACRHLVNDPGIAAEMAGVLGFSNVVARPYGVDPEVFRPVTDVAPSYDLVFCLGTGCPPPTALMRAELDAPAPDHDAIRHAVAADVPSAWPPLLAGLPIAARDGVHRLLEALLAIQLRDRATPMLRRLETVLAAEPDLAPAVTTLFARPSLWVHATATLRRVEQWERAFVFTYLARRFRCAVFSNPSLDGWDCPAERLGWVTHRDQSVAYARGRVALNVMRWQDEMGLNPKPMEITASGVACLGQRRSGLSELYHAGEEIAVFDTAGEACVQLETLLADDARRRDLAEAGLTRTRRDHTWAVRAAELLPILVPAAASGRAQDAAWTSTVRT